MANGDVGSRPRERLVSPAASPFCLVLFCSIALPFGWGRLQRHTTREVWALAPCSKGGSQDGLGGFFEKYL